MFVSAKAMDVGKVFHFLYNIQNSLCVKDCFFPGQSCPCCRALVGTPLYACP